MTVEVAVRVAEAEGVEVAAAEVAQVMRAAQVMRVAQVVRAAQVVGVPLLWAERDHVVPLLGERREHPNNIART